MQDSINPFSWGWKQELFSLWQQEVSSLKLQPDISLSLIPARITAKNHHKYDIVCPDFSSITGFLPDQKTSGFFYQVPVQGSFEYSLEDESSYPVTGDWVMIQIEGTVLRIKKVLPRMTNLSRGRAGNTSAEQVLASNIDTLFIINALDGGRNFLPSMIERALILAGHSGSQAHIILNKADLASGEYKEEVLHECEISFPSIPCTLVSAKTGEGMDVLNSYYQAGTTIGMLGKSGMGKSALVNALGKCRYGSEGERAGISNTADSHVHSLNENAVLEGEVRQSDLRGRHTTTSSRLYRLSSGLLIIDSPGIRELKLWGTEDDIEESFADIASLSAGCRFSDCTHTGEPGCSVQEALESGILEQKRYLRYLELSREIAFLETRTSENARRNEERKWKQISKFQKSLKKERGRY